MLSAHGCEIRELSVPLPPLPLRRREVAVMSEATQETTDVGEVERVAVADQQLTDIVAVKCIERKEGLQSRDGGPARHRRRTAFAW